MKQTHPLRPVSEDDLKNVNIVDYLSALNHFPDAGFDEKIYYDLVPLASKDASLVIACASNTWRDTLNGLSGDVVDLASYYWDVAREGIIAKPLQYGFTGLI